ncbi:UDP-N-acetyl-D-glucosamine 6-dehydrogenase 1 [Phlyctema vagabunda]|uniref:UDP-N-acetyl-D-glucosamine 6-dehydrogenase 1 n=1 Tax=Phlyctema vagabunda TaxID=108571 RepID=A0ABR4PCZ6_9HELO
MELLSAPSLTHSQSWNLASEFEKAQLYASGSSTGTASPRSVWSSDDSRSTFQETPVSAYSNTEDYFSNVREDETPVVAVIGVGYVGLHLATAFSKHYKVVAFDVSDTRLAAVKKNLPDQTDIYLTSDETCLTPATHFLVAVPTPLVAGTTDIDTSIIQASLNTISRNVRPGATVIIESSVSVGMTRSLLTEMVIKYRLQAGMSPERVDPGRTYPPYESIPKIISGLDDVAPDSLKYIQKLYGRVFENIVPVSCPEVAEMTKLYENCQRMVCIAYANEMADACQDLNIDAFEVSRAAATKPFGYLPFTPSAGVGGHCIPVNPSYLFNVSEFPLLRHATDRMNKRPAALAERTMQRLIHGNPTCSSKRKYKILVVGVAFKPGQELTTNSPGVGIINHLLDKWDSHVSFADPLVSEDALPYVPKLDDAQEWNREKLNAFDAILIVMKQVGLNLDILGDLENVLIEQYCA